MGNNYKIIKNYLLHLLLHVATTTTRKKVREFPLQKKLPILYNFNAEEKEKTLRNKERKMRKKIANSEWK